VDVALLSLLEIFVIGVNHLLTEFELLNHLLLLEEVFVVLVQFFLKVETQIRVLGVLVTHGTKFKSITNNMHSNFKINAEGFK
jgi:hypothetical protein